MESGESEKSPQGKSSAFPSTSHGGASKLAYELYLPKIWVVKKQLDSVKNAISMVEIISEAIIPGCYMINTIFHNNIFMK